MRRTSRTSLAPPPPQWLPSESASAVEPSEDPEEDSPGQSQREERKSPGTQPQMEGLHGILEAFEHPSPSPAPTPPESASPLYSHSQSPAKPPARKLKDKLKIQNLQLGGGCSEVGNRLTESE